jgi:hypothetical protein
VVFDISAPAPPPADQAATAAVALPPSLRTPSPFKTGAAGRRPSSPHQTRARAPDRSERTGRPGSRRYRRYMNEKCLADQGAALTAGELEAAMRAPRAVPTPWMFGSSHDDPESEARWERFTRMEEAAQEQLLRRVEEENTSRRRPAAAAAAAGGGARVDRRTRALLRPHLGTEFFTATVRRCFPSSVSFK